MVLLITIHQRPNDETLLAMGHRAAFNNEQIPYRKTNYNTPK